MMTNGSGELDWSDKKVFTTGEAAQVCNVSQQTIIRCFDSGRLQGFRVPGSKFRRIPREELVRFMRDNAIPLDQLEGGRRRVLVVDDDPEIVELFREVLGREGRFDVESASTGYEAGLLTERFRPHLIVLDYMLPDINGDVVLGRIAEQREEREIAVLIVSGVVNRTEVDGLLTRGADAFLKKPFDLGELRARIYGLLGIQAPAAAVRPAP